MKFNEMYNHLMEMPHVALSGGDVVDLKLEDVPMNHLEGLKSHIQSILTQVSDSDNFIDDILKNPTIVMVLHKRFNLTPRAFRNLIKA